jgi:hypothetical protein
MRRWIYIIFVCLAVLIVVQACVFPWQSSLKMASVMISRNSGALPPDYYKEEVMNIIPDYELRTISVDYSATMPFKKEKSEDDTFKGDAIVGGEYFDRFEEIVDMADNYSAKTESDGCVGGSMVSIGLKTADGKEKTVSIYSCGGGGDGVLIDGFYGDIIDLLTKNVY